MQFPRIHNLKLRVSAVAAAVAVAVVCGAYGQVAENPELAEGLRYIRGLQSMYFSDIADLVLKELSVKFPQARAQFAVIQLEAQLARGQFDEVKQRIAREKDQNSPEVWGMKLALADAYYAYNRYPECKALYESFLNAFEVGVATPRSTVKSSGIRKGPLTKEIEDLYSESVYKYAQMLLNLKEREAALGWYEVLTTMKKRPPEHVERQCLAEMSEIALALAEESKSPTTRAAYCQKVDKWADKLLWKQDLWFGKAIVLKAHALMLQHRAEDARKLVDTYMGTLTLIHESLVEAEKETGERLTRVSPMAECRFLIASMLQDEAQSIIDREDFSPNNPKQREEVLSMLLGSRNKAGKRAGDGAYNHFVNVFAKYPESNWAAEAGQRAEQVRLILVDVFGGRVKASVTPEQTARVREIQYRDARTLYAQGQIESARDRLIQVLNSFPDCPESIPALGDLEKCYVQLSAEDPDAVLYADTVASHLAERYSGKPEYIASVGDELLRLAEYWGECGRPDKRMEVFDLFFKFYPLHSSCASYLNSFGEKAFQDEDYPTALSYFQQVATTYTNSPRAMDALNRIMSIYDVTKDYSNLVIAASAYIDRFDAKKPTQAMLAARYRLAQGYRDYGLQIFRSGTTNQTELVAGDKYIKLAVKEFGDLSDLLDNPPASVQVNDAEKKANLALHEASLYNMGYSLTQIRFPATAVPKFRMAAVKAFNKLVDSFPKSKTAPSALIQVGSIYTTFKDVKNAEAALSRLRRDYPDSEQARSALPMIADNLMKLGMREEAIARYREMFAGPGASQYSDADVLRAVKALISAKEYDLARQGVDRLLASAKDQGILARARLVDAELLTATEDYKEAVDKLKAYIKDFPNYSLTIDANLLLAKAASEAGALEKDDLQRKLFFNSAIDAMKDVERRRTNSYDRAVADIGIGRIMARKAKVEKDLGKPTARDNCGKALISYKGFVEGSSSGIDSKVLPLVETAYFEMVPLEIDCEMWEYVLEDCNEYLTRFPRGRYRSQIEAWRAQARVEVGASNTQQPDSETAPSTSTSDK